MGTKRGGHMGGRVERVRGREGRKKKNLLEKTNENIKFRIHICIIMYWCAHFDFTTIALSHIAMY